MPAPWTSWQAKPGRQLKTVLRGPVHALPMSSLAATAVAVNQAQTKAQLATIIQKQQHQAEASLVALLQQSTEALQAATPPGVGGKVDVTA